ncbi:hypothetical protein [Roseibium suaedae]|uniref:hypothetical protein n=1 Tax=Roseibium suaedae TaxID=735517 RepID=UPI001AD92FB8|nr:hypothetical protein [Roseibium suaedae]
MRQRFALWLGVVTWVLAASVSGSSAQELAPPLSTDLAAPFSAALSSDALPMPPAPKPHPDAPAEAAETPIENLLDRAPEPLFSDTLVPYAPSVHLNPAGAPAENQGALYLMARLNRDSQPIEKGLIWRIYSETTNEEGRLELVSTSEGGDAEFRLDPGVYLIHTAYGYATAVNRIVMGRDVKSKMVTLNAGGLKLEAALTEDNAIKKGPLLFDIYGTEFDERGERKLVAQNVQPGKIIRLAADTYHVVSRYGDVNAVVRADIQVIAGKLTEATMHHKAAGITLKLVNAPGGEAIANTSWAVLSPGGDVVVEANGAFPRFVLASGEYEVIARNNGVNYRSDFEVQTGNDREVEVMASDENTAVAN